MKVELFNGQSYIELVDFTAMGNRGEYCGDWAIVDGARVSFGRKASEFSFEKNKELAEYLWDAGDRSPFDQFVMQFRVRVPISIALWWFLFPHASYDEISGRYTKVISEMDRCFVPPDFSEDLTHLLRTEFETSTRMYQSLYDPNKFTKGEKQVAKELARAALLYTFSTEFIFTVSLRKLAHFMLQFVNHPLFQEVHSAFFQFIKAYAPIFYAQFEPYWSKLKAEKPEWPHQQDHHFLKTHRGILDDDISALRLENVVGSDRELARTLRISYGYSGDDYTVIKRVLAKSKGDNIPPEFSEIGLRLAIRCPVYIFRQMYRHKRAAWYGLSTHTDKFYIPRTWRAQTQGSRYEFAQFTKKENAALTQRFSAYIEERTALYQKLLLEGVSDRHGERFLPYCFYVSVFRNSDGIELFNFLNLRCDWHAQYEHQQYALKVAELFAKHLPLTFIAWYEEYWKGRNEKVDELYRKLA